jgi:D-xylose transport system ATP-binding protein
VLISHNMTEVLQVANRIAVLYLGQTAAQVRRDEVNQQELVELITTGGLSGRTLPVDTDGVPA